MRTKKSIKERLATKKIKELKAVYVHICGHDLLRGTKAEMVNQLNDLLLARTRWNIIAGGKS